MRYFDVMHDTSHVAALVTGLAFALAFVLVPLLRQRAAGVDPAARRLRALDEAFAAGVIDADEHARKRAAIAPSREASALPSRSAFAALLLVALLLPASALLLYRLVGAPQALDPANVAAATGEHGPDMERRSALSPLGSHSSPTTSKAQAM